MKKIIKIISSLLLVTFFFYNFSFAELNALWFTKSLNVQVGDTVNIDLYIDPRPDHPVVTVSNSLTYDYKKLKFVEATFPDTWFVLSESPNTLTDEKNGFLRRTAGFPNGVNENTKYITYTFKAIAEGPANLFIDDGQVLDFENTDLGFQKKQMRINIAAKKPELTTNIETSLDNEILANPEPEISEPEVLTMSLKLFDKEIVYVNNRNYLDIHKYEFFSLFAIIIFIAFIYHIHRDHVIFRKLRTRAKEYHEIRVEHTGKKW